MKRKLFKFEFGDGTHWIQANSQEQAINEFEDCVGYQLEPGYTVKEVHESEYQDKTCTMVDVPDDVPGSKDGKLKVPFVEIICEGKDAELVASTDIW